MVNGKSLLVDIAPEERTDGKEAQRSVVDVLSGDIFYPATGATPVADFPTEYAQAPTEPVTAMSSY